MELDQEFGLEHLLFVQRKCKICGEIKTLTDDFYKTRKDRGNTSLVHMHMNVNPVISGE